MENINTILVEKILWLNDKIIKFAEKNIFNNTELTPTQFNILWEIIKHKSITINDLKDLLIISAPAISQLINRMEKNELIKRSFWVDRREIVLTPTKKAVILYNELNLKYVEITNEKLQVLKNEEKTLLIEMLKKIETNINF